MTGSGYACDSNQCSPKYLRLTSFRSLRDRHEQRPLLPQHEGLLSMYPLRQILLLICRHTQVEAPK